MQRFNICSGTFSAARVPESNQSWKKQHIKEITIVPLRAFESSHSTRRQPRTLYPRNQEQRTRQLTPADRLGSKREGPRSTKPQAASNTIHLELLDIVVALYTGHSHKPKKRARQARAERRRSHMKFRVAVGAPSLLIGCWVGALQELIRLRLDCRLIETLRKGSVLGSSPANKHGVTQDEEQSESPRKGPGGQKEHGPGPGRERETANPGPQSSRFAFQFRRPVLGSAPFLLLARFLGRRPFVSEPKTGGSFDLGSSSLICARIWCRRPLK